LHIYLFNGIVGAILFIILYHFSKKNEYKICSLIPSIPILGLFGLYALNMHNGNKKEYIRSHAVFLLITTFFYFTMLFLLNNNFSFYISLIIGLILWLLITVCNLYF